ncbi:MAG: DNA polymerase/3'-5' exonuclease PolX [Candidatus Stahlbacteria bacterium]|nr:MAG: DNA polymerase/3'-5' exonuclease PolX [Candidatus Stahlbacteria bacterium]
MKNHEVAEILSKIAKALALKDENFFKIRAYSRAARAIKDLPEDIEEISKKESITNIPGVGEGIAKKVKEYLETGKMSKYEEVTRDIPKSFLTLLDIRDLGSKTLGALHKELGVENLDDLKKVIEDGSFQKLEGLGDKSAKKIIENIKVYEERMGKEHRFLIGEVMATVDQIVKKLKEVDSVSRVAPAGSYRRVKETVGDLDILVESNDNRKVMKKFTAFSEVKKVLESGETKTSIVVEGLDIQMDLRVVPKESFGAALMYFTGSKDHNVRIRSLALKRGLKVNEYGVFRNDTMVAGKTEEEIYKFLNLQFIPPEIREDRGEVEKAIEGQLPKLLGYDDIKGNLHTHTRYSDGENTIRELVKKSIEFGYSYLGISDHSKTASYANGLSVNDLKKQCDEIDKLNKEFDKIRILKGIECDILPDGSLDYDENILKSLDFVIGAIHSNFKKKVTQRMEKALENPYLTVLAHPTGRLISKREGYDVDLGSVLDKANKEGKILEINAYYDRLDLDEHNAREAYKKGIKLMINTDAHNLRMFDWMILGIGIARRAWLPSSAIVNTLTLKDFLKAIKRNG